jgi:ferredoxin
MKISVDSAMCQGHNRCIAVAPDLFEIDEEGFASAAGDGVVPSELEEKADLAVDNCPEQAIRIEHDA